MIKKPYLSIEDLEILFNSLNFPSWLKFSDMSNNTKLYFNVRNIKNVIPQITHEISHFAIKPNWYLDSWYARRGYPYTLGFDIPKSDCLCSDIACSNSNSRDEYISYFKAIFGDDMTPDEWGARAWGILVLKKLNKTLPKSTKHYNPLIFADTRSLRHPIALCGFDQLKVWGIDEFKLRPNDTIPLLDF